MAPETTTHALAHRPPQHHPPGTWARLVARRPRRMLAVALVLLLAGAALAAGVMDRLLLSRFESPGSRSAQVETRLTDEFGTGKHHALLLVTATGGDVDTPDVQAAADALERELAARPAVAETDSYWAARSPAMRSADGSQALITMRLHGTVTQARGALADLSPAFTRDGDVVSVRVGGGDEIFRQAAQQARTDFARAELVVFPLVFGLLLLVYRRPSVAALTLGMGLFSVVTGLGLIRLVTQLTDVSTFAANLTLVMGVGLGVDYSLFVITRFREELARGLPVPEAVAEAVSRAGRTVAFSGLTVAVSLACLLLFPFPFLQSFAYAGVGTVATSVLAALLVLPAALGLVGHRMRPARAPRADGGWWHATATRMMRRPLLWGAPALLLVLLLAAPVLGLRLGLPDARVLPEGTTSRDVQDQIQAHFDLEQMDAVQVLVDQPAATPAGRAAVDDYATRLSQVPGVGQVDTLTGRYAGGHRVAGPPPDAARFGSDAATWFSAVPQGAALADVDGLIARVDAVPAPAASTVGGYPADLVEFRAALLSSVPVVLGAILAVTFVLLFLLTGSLLLPLKAIVLNLLSLSVMFGVLVWGFQDGHLAGLLGFTPTGTLEATFPILMFCVAFGLSMDYEVFLMARIKEEHDRTGDNTGAVATGLQHSGPLVTAAATILAASFLTYVVSDVVYLKILAVGMAVVILVDATLIRAVLVPVLMRLAGEANWWAPAPLRRLHRRIGLSH